MARRWVEGVAHRVTGAVGPILCAGLLAGCASELPPTCDATTYADAVRDSAEPTAADVSTALWPIRPDNPRLTWNADGSAVRVAVWTTWTGYQVGELTLSREVWVTPAPQLKELCAGVPADQLVPRVNQILGLPPVSEADAGRYFVELWARPADLFRPCPDAEIDDDRCELAFPESATPEHRAWIANQYAGSHGFWQKVKYPWTGLGYTYDWCNAATTVGASELVVRAGSSVTVTGIFPREAYCAP